MCKQRIHRRLDNATLSAQNVILTVDPITYRETTVVRASANTRSFCLVVLVAVVTLSNFGSQLGDSHR